MRLIDAGKLKCDVLRLFDMHPELFNFKSRVRILSIIDDQPTRNADDSKVLYICDKRYCEKCNNPDCHYTMDISHAANFEKNKYGDYQEKSEIFIDGEFLKYIRKSPEEKEQKPASTPLSMEVDLDKINVDRELKMLKWKEEEEKKKSEALYRRLHNMILGIKED